MEEKALGKNSLLKFISDLETYESESNDMLSAYLTRTSSLSQIPESISGIVAKRLAKHPLGAVVFYWEKGNIKILMFPPLPVGNEIFLGRKFLTSQLKEILTKECTLGIVLLRLGEYAIGIFEGKKLVLSKCGKRFLRGKHKKGGYSQSRFARDREAKMNVFFDEVYNILRTRFEPYLEKLDYVLYGGAGITIRKFQERNHFMKRLKEKTLDRIIEIPRANKKVLDDILFEVWKTRILQF